MNEELLNRAKAQIVVKIFKLTLELLGFGLSLAVSILLILNDNKAFYMILLSLVSGYMTGVFAHRYTLGIFNTLLEMVVASQKGTLMALGAIKDGGLDNWDCGDPSCEGCKKAREARDAEPQAKIGFRTGGEK